MFQLKELLVQLIMLWSIAWVGLIGNFRYQAIRFLHQTASVHHRICLVYAIFFILLEFCKVNLSNIRRQCHRTERIKINSLLLFVK
jgi:hypothetical protein